MKGRLIPKSCRKLVLASDIYRTVILHFFSRGFYFIEWNSSLQFALGRDFVSSKMCSQKKTVILRSWLQLVHMILVSVFSKWNSISDPTKVKLKENLKGCILESIVSTEIGYYNNLFLRTKYLVIFMMGWISVYFYFLRSIFFFGGGEEKNVDPLLFFDEIWFFISFDYMFYITSISSFFWLNFWEDSG